MRYYSLTRYTTVHLDYGVVSCNATADQWSSFDYIGEAVRVVTARPEDHAVWNCMPKYEGLFVCDEEG